MTNPHAPSPSRRHVLASGGAIGAGLLLAACGSNGDDGSDGSSSGAHANSRVPSGPWTFKDDRGKTATADKTPQRIVAYVSSAAALHDFGIECVGVFGPTKQKNGKPDIQAGNLDVDKLTSVGNNWGEFNVEKYATLQPDLLVSNMNTPPSLWYIPDDSKDKILDLSPSSIGILTAKTSLRNAIQRYATLAESLGADLKAKQVTDAKARFEKASETLRQAAKGKRGLKLLAVSASSDNLHVGNPQSFTDLRYYQQLGANIGAPGKTDELGFFRAVSWEQADSYEADLILVDRRTGNLQPDELRRSKPTWRNLPAVKAGQVIPWFSEPQYSYAGIAPLIEDLARAIQDARKLV
ncbi:ABC transporter substrate-binding protein [Streptomyces zagrosensis]|nr:ABC transporter substrate-binding protein [Streptomyces zagrosensis]